jgi:death on curing protein
MKLSWRLKKSGLSFTAALQTEHLLLDDVLAIHRRLIEKHGGTDALYGDTKEKLESALAQPGAVLFGHVAFPTIYEQAAAYLYFIAKAHAFVDGNKRTAWGNGCIPVPEWL